jgi:hypothetical protein
MDDDRTDAGRVRFIERIAPKVRAVSSIYREHIAATEEESAAERELLLAILDCVAPALDALCSALPGSYDSAAEPRDQPREERGAVLINRFRRASRGRSGVYFGDALVLLSTGQFARMEREGAWSSVADQRSWWTTTLAPLEVADVARLFGGVECLRAIDQALDAELEGAAPRRSGEALERAAKLRAVCLLLEETRVVAVGLDAAGARRLWAAGRTRGFETGTSDPNEAATHLAGGSDGLALGARVLYRCRHDNDVAIVRTEDARIVAIGIDDERTRAVAVDLGEIDAKGRFEPR